MGLLSMFMNHEFNWYVEHTYIKYPTNEYFEFMHIYTWTRQFESVRKRYKYDYALYSCHFTLRFNDKHIKSYYYS